MNLVHVYAKFAHVILYKIYAIFSCKTNNPDMNEINRPCQGCALRQVTRTA